jgi:hypothetical protein
LCRADSGEGHVQARIEFRKTIPVFFVVEIMEKCYLIFKVSYVYANVVEAMIC